MGRIKLHIEGKPIASINIPVRITDINYGNHLGNDSLVSMVHEARVAWLTQNNYTELNIEGASLIQGDLVVEYVKESFYGDVLSIDISAADITRVSFDLNYHIHTNRNGQTITIARAKTGLVCYDYTLKKVMAVPEKLITLLSGC